MTKGDKWISVYEPETTELGCCAVITPEALCKDEMIKVMTRIIAESFHRAILENWETAIGKCEVHIERLEQDGEYPDIPPKSLEVTVVLQVIRNKNATKRLLPPISIIESCVLECHNLMAHLATDIEVQIREQLLAEVPHSG